MGFGTLAIIAAAGLIGPLLALRSGWNLPIVLGELLAGIVLGEVGVFEAIQRSFRLARSRWRLALVVALFGIASQFIVLFGVSIGGDVVVTRVLLQGCRRCRPPRSAGMRRR